MRTSYSKKINYLLETHTTDDVIADINAENLRFTQLSDMMPIENLEALWSKVLHCNLLFDEYIQMGIFIEG